MSELQYPRVLIVLVVVFIVLSIELENIFGVIQGQEKDFVKTLSMIISICIGGAILLSLLVSFILKKLTLCHYFTQYLFFSIFPLVGMVGLVALSVYNLVASPFRDHPSFVPYLGDLITSSIGLSVAVWVCCCVKCTPELKDEEFGCICWPITNIWKPTKKEDGVKMDIEVVAIHSKWFFVFLYLLMEIYFLYSNTVFMIRNWQWIENLPSSTQGYCTKIYLVSLGLDIALVGLGGAGVLLAVLTICFTVKEKLDPSLDNFPRLVRFMNVFVAVGVVLLVLVDTVGDFLCELVVDKLYDYVYVFSAGANLVVVLILWLSFVDHHPKPDYEDITEKHDEEDSRAHSMVPLKI